MPDGSGDSTSLSTDKIICRRAFDITRPHHWKVVLMKPLRVQELMRECQAAVIADTALLRQAAETLVVNNLSVLIAIGQDGSISGLIPEAAIIRHLMGTSNRSETVSPILSRHVESVRPEADLNSVLHLFRSSCHSVIPGVNIDRHVVGLLHRSDVVRMLLENTTTDQNQPTGPQQKPHFMGRGERSEKVEKETPADDAQK